MDVMPIMSTPKTAKLLVVRIKELDPAAPVPHLRPSIRRMISGVTGSMSHSMVRVMTRILLGVVLLLSVVVLITSLFRTLNSTDATPWAAIAAALAVITSLVSAWGAQRMLEIQQDSMLPDPYPSIDAHNRYGLLQFRITNFGGSPGYNIRISWDKPLLNIGHEPVVIGHDANNPHIPVLLPKDSISTYIDGHIEFFKTFQDANYGGTISYYDASGNRYEKQFSVSAEMYRNTPLFSEEGPKTHHELQKLPEAIANLTKAVKDLKS